MQYKIPNKFRVGGQEIEVKFPEILAYDKMGDCCMWSGELNISNTYKGHPQCESSKLNTFNHELVHIILDTMGEYELSNNERFVCSFAGFLTDALTSFEYK